MPVYMEQTGRASGGEVRILRAPKQYWIDGRTGAGGIERWLYRRFESYQSS